ncbi:MAG: hypothetical protein HPY44_11250 [Armatimonadetes bacterium]|nr:hypothetical protein [Armatimonadota bacterium]
MRVRMTCWVLVVAVLAVAVPAVYADGVAVENARGKAYLTLVVDDPTDFHSLLISVMRGRVQDFTAPPGWVATPEGTSAVRFVPDGTDGFFQTGVAAGFMMKVSGRGTGTWATYYTDGTGLTGPINLK